MKPSSVAFLVMIGAGTITTGALAGKPSNAAATPTSEGGSVSEEASLHFQRAVKLYRDRSFDAALAEFNRAYELAPDYRVLYNLGQVHTERADYVAAVKHFRQYLTEGGDAIPDARTADVQAEIARLEGRIAKLRVVSNVEGAEVVIDGEPVGTLPLSLVPVNAGVRRIVVRKKGYESNEQRLTLTGGEERNLDIKLEKDSSLPSTTRPSHAEQPSSSSAGSSPAASREASAPANTRLWISLAVTGVAAGATTVFALMTRRAEEKFEDELAVFPGSESRIDSARNEMKRTALITDICGGLTVIGIGATVYFAVAGSPATKSESKSSSTTWQTGPFGPGLGWQVRGRF